MGDPRLLAEVASRSSSSTRRSCTQLLAGHAGHDGAAERRRPRRAADRRAAARGDLRRDSQPALSRCRGGAVHGAGQSEARRRSPTRSRRAGKAACRCPACAAWCRATRSCATRASTRRQAASTASVEGFHARVVQHECDHLDGILYPMRMRDMTRFGFTEVLFPGQELPRKTSAMARTEFRKRGERVRSTRSRPSRRRASPRRRRASASRRSARSCSSCRTRCGARR